MSATVAAAIRSSSFTNRAIRRSSPKTNRKAGGEAMRLKDPKVKGPQFRIRGPLRAIISNGQPTALTQWGQRSRRWVKSIARRGNLAAAAQRRIQTHRVVEARTYGALILFEDGRAGGRRPTCSPGGWEGAPLKGGPGEGDYFAGACVPEASSEGGPPGGLARRHPTSPHQPRGLRNAPRLGIVRSCQTDPRFAVDRAVVHTAPTSSGWSS
jgi:hypothetical protein